MAVDATTHELYVADRGNARVDQFSSSGTFIRAWGWGVADGMPAFEACATICQQGTPGAGAGQFTSPTFVAVDNSTGPSAGDVYVADKADGLISKFTAEGALVESWGAHGQLNGSTSGAGSFGEIAGIAVDAQGTLLVINGSSTLFKYSQNGTFVEDFTVARGTSADGLAVNAEGDFFKVNGEPTVEEQRGAEASGDIGQVTNKGDTTGIAIDSATGDLYDAEGRTVEHYSAAGPGLFQEPNGTNCTVEPSKGCAATNSFGGTTLRESAGIAVDPTDAEVYVSEASTGKVYAFVPAVVPDVTTGGASNIAATSATLGGNVDPDGTEVTGCAIEYGLTAYTVNEHSVPCTLALPYTGSSPVPVTADISGLSAGTTYYYKLVASDASGAAEGSVESFVTRGPRISNARAANVEPTRSVVKAEINPGGESTTYIVEYGTTTAYGSSTPPAGIGSGEEFVAIAAHVGGLQPKTTYHLRVVAQNGSATTASPDVELTTPAVLTNEYFSEVGTNVASLHAEIDASGEPTTYRVEYGATTAYGSSTSPVGVGAGEGPVDVVSRLTELAPGTDYHFRFVAESANHSEDGPDLSFTTYPLSPPGLPDGRGYEMVTPAGNDGFEVYAPMDAGYATEDAINTFRPVEASADGDAVTYAGDPTAGGNGSQGDGEGNQLLARRSAEGWSQADIQPLGYKSPDYWGFSSDLQHGVLSSTEPLVEGAPSGEYHDLYTHDTATGSSQPLFTDTPRYRGPYQFEAVYAGASADFTHLLFQANDALTPEAEGGEEAAEEPNLYESVDGQLHSVNVLPNGKPALNATFGSAEPGTRGLDFSHVISSDGSRIFWTDRNNRSLYVRENGNVTKLIAEEATFLTASADGSKVLYTQGGDLYEENIETGLTRDLAPHGEVMGILGASEDLQYVYFVATAVLAPHGSSGQSNLYLSHDGETRFIATLGSEGEENESGIYPHTGGYVNTLPWGFEIGRRTAEVTPSGRDVVFMSKRSLTGYDNLSRSESEPQREVYVYDAESGALSCASCDPTGEQPASRGELAGQQPGGFLAISGFPTYQLRFISEDGSRVFFESAEPLLTQTKSGVLNVYEWERNGAGSCRFTNGCLSLLSTGSSSSTSYFLDASASGNDVFLLTRSQLVPSDQNEYNDVYDARVGVVEAPTTRCTGTGCQGVAASPPVFATPASVTYDGVGNLAAQPTPVGKPKAKPKTKPKAKKKRKQASGCTKKKQPGSKSRGLGKRAKAKPVLCKARKAAKRVRRTNERGGR